MAEIGGIGRYKKKDKSEKSRIVHLALKVTDLETATKFYENVFGFKQLSTHHSRGHYSRHLTDGELDLALMLYDSEEVEEAQWAGAGPRIHHWGIEVADKGAFADAITRHGGSSSRTHEGALKFRAQACRNRGQGPLREGTGEALRANIGRPRRRQCGGDHGVLGSRGLIRCASGAARRCRCASHSIMKMTALADDRESLRSPPSATTLSAFLKSRMVSSPVRLQTMSGRPVSAVTRSQMPSGPCNPGAQAAGDTKSRAPSALRWRGMAGV